jgi:hypothetical protein
VDWSWNESSVRIRAGMREQYVDPTLSFHLRSTYCSLIPAPLHILLSHSSSDPHCSLITVPIHILLSHSISDPQTTLSFQLRSTYCSLIPAPIHILLSHSVFNPYTTLYRRKHYLERTWKLFRISVESCEA